MIPIPYGTRYTTTVRGSVFKEVICENCKDIYVYQVDREAHGSGESILWLNNDGARLRSSKAAEEALKDELGKAIEPVPCPGCGWLQASMCSILKQRCLYACLWLAIPLAMLLPIVALVTHSNQDPSSKAERLNAIGLAIAVCGAVGGALWSFLHNPNAGHPGGGASDAEKASASIAITMTELQESYERATEQWAENCLRRLIQSMAQVATADGSTVMHELDRIVAVYEQIIGDAISIDDAKRFLTEQEWSKADLLHSLAESRQDMGDEARLLYIRAALAMAANDGAISSCKWHFILDLGATLNISTHAIEQMAEHGGGLE